MEDKEIYSAIQCLDFGDSDEKGCCYFGHFDTEQFKRVAIDWMKTECGLESEEDYMLVRKGYYKVVPAKGYQFNAMYHFSEHPIRGAKKVMELRFQ